MAKRIEPFPDDEIPQSFKEAVTSFDLRGILIARKFVPLPALTPEQIAEQTAIYEAAKASWAVLHTWKKVRWSLCAIATYGDPSAVKGAPGYSGYSLYIKCWLEQQTETGKQPISPCSARATDPGASPWNYQP
jgi:hypothetical protein